MNKMLVLLDRIIEQELVNIVFQPIVSLKNGKVIGYEALSRGPKNTPLERPDILFEFAKKCGRLWKLEALCRKKALERVKELNENEWKIFLNVGPVK